MTGINVVNVIKTNIYVYIHVQTKDGSGKGNNQNVLGELDQESSITFEIYSDYACLKMSRQTLITKLIDSFLEQSRSNQSIYSI